MKNNHMILIAIIAILFLSGCVENAESVSEAATYLVNQDVMDEFTLYLEHLAESTKAYDGALNKYNEDINRYNDFIFDYNDMSYFQQTSSTTVNKKSTLKSNYKSSARSLIVQCEVMESQIDDLFIFMEANKKVIMNFDSKSYLEIKSTLTQNKASIRGSKAVANEMLYK